MTKRTHANKVLDQLLALDDGTLRNVLSVAQEYSGTPAIHDQSMPAGQRLLWLIERGLAEVTA